MKEFIIIISFITLWMLSAYVHDWDLVRQAEAGKITFWSTDKVYIIKD